MDPLLIIMVLAVGAMFLLTSRTRKQQKQAVEFRQTLAVGDEVMTGSGLFGTVVDIDGDVVTLESPSGARTDWLRAAISKLASPPWSEADEDEGDDVDEDELVADASDETYLEEPDLLPEAERTERDTDGHTDDEPRDPSLHLGEPRDRPDGPAGPRRS